MTRHPKILEQLAKLLPARPYHAGSTLSGYMGLDLAGRRALATTVEEAFAIRLDDRQIPHWRTLGDVAQAIADSLALETA